MKARYAVDVVSQICNQEKRQQLVSWKECVLGKSSWAGANPPGARSMWQDTSRNSCEGNPKCVNITRWLGCPGWVVVWVAIVSPRSYDVNLNMQLHFSTSPTTLGIY